MSYMNMEYGDLVQIKTWNEMLAEGFTMRSNGGLESEDYDIFSKEMKDLCGKKFIIKIKYNIGYSTRIKRMSNQNGNYTIHACFVKVIEKGFLQKSRNNKIIADINENINDEIIKEMISKVDILKIKKILAGSTDNNLNELNGLNKLLIQWAEAKKDIYLLLGKELSITNKAELSIEDSSVVEEKMKEIKNKFPQYTPILEDLSYDEIKENKIDYINRCDEVFNNKIKGMKVTKFFSSYFNNKELDIELSKIYQDKVTTNITISINPSDYLLMSKNNSGWKSCHNVCDEEGDMGCYAGGTLSYMCDDTTLIAYSHSDEKVKIKIKNYEIKDYSKNWRQCVYYDKVNKAIVFSRQYPNFSVQKCKHVRDMMEELVCSYNNIKNKWILMKSDILGEYVENNEGALNYNDCEEYELYNTEPECYYMAYNKEIVSNKSEISIKIGSQPICPICGEHKVTDHEELVCNSCVDDSDY